MRQTNLQVKCNVVLRSRHEESLSASQVRFSPHSFFKCPVDDSIAWSRLIHRGTRAGCAGPQPAEGHLSRPYPSAGSSARGPLRRARCRRTVKGARRPGRAQPPVRRPAPQRGAGREEIAPAHRAAGRHNGHLLRGRQTTRFGIAFRSDDDDARHDVGTIELA